MKEKEARTWLRLDIGKINFHSTAYLTFITMPPRTDLEPYRELLTERRRLREPIRETLVFLNELIAINGGRSDGLRTLEKQLSIWGLTGSTARINLAPFYDDICERTLYTQLQEWELNTRHAGVQISDELIEWVKHCFFCQGFSDTIILRDLQREGFQANLWTIRQIRYSHGMKRRATKDSEKHSP